MQIGVRLTPGRRTMSGLAGGVCGQPEKPAKIGKAGSGRGGPRGARRTAESQRVEQVECIVAAGAADQGEVAVEVDGEFDDAFGAADGLLIGEQGV